MPKTKSPCTVTIVNGEAQCNPDPVDVSRANNDGVIWTMATPGYHFTGVSISPDSPVSRDDFGEPEFGTNAANQSTMSVSDTVQDLIYYSYTVQYAADTGETGSFDPKIHNKE